MIKNAKQKIPIQVDDRESRAPVLRALRQCADFEVTVTRLNSGDYLVDERFLFERTHHSMAMITCPIFSPRSTT